jgi:hypothetical protein
MSEQLNISRQFAQSIFIHFLGIVFHSMATPGKDEYTRQIELFSRLIEPLIADASENMEQAVEKTRDNIVNLLMKNPGPNGEPAFVEKGVKKSRGNL